MDLSTQGGAGEHDAGVTNQGEAFNHVGRKGNWNCKAGNDTR